MPQHEPPMPPDFDTTIALGTNLPSGPYDVTIAAPRTGKTWATQGRVAEATLWLRAAELHGKRPVSASW